MSNGNKLENIKIKKNLFDFDVKIDINFELMFCELRSNTLYLSAFLIKKIRKIDRYEMDKKFLTHNFRHSFLQLYCGLTY